MFVLCVCPMGTVVCAKACVIRNTQKRTEIKQPPVEKTHSYSLSHLRKPHCPAHVFIRDAEAVSFPMMPWSLYKTGRGVQIISPGAGVCG